MKYLDFLIFLLAIFIGQACQLEGVQRQVPTIGFLDAFEDETIAQANEGFFAALAEQGYREEDQTLKVIYRNAQGDIPTLVQATDYMISRQVDLIATNPTVSTITAVQNSQKIPVCMMVSSRPDLVNLTDDEGNPPERLFGVYEDLDYIATSVEIIKELQPKAQKIGVIFNQAEPQSINARKRIAETCQDIGLELIASPVNNSSETQLVVESLINKGIDAFFAMPDNVVFASFEVIYKACDQADIPIFTSEEGLVKRGAVAAYGADMYQWGFQAGKEAAQYFKGDQRRIPALEKVHLHKKIYNAEVAQKYGIQVDNSFTKVEDSAIQASAEKNTASEGFDFNNFYLSALMLGLGLSAMGIGIFISMRIFDIPDITTDGSYTLGAAVTAVMLVNQYPLYLIVLAVIGSGVLAGISTGFIHAKLKVNALLAGILVMTGLYSVNLMIMGRSNIPLLDQANLLDMISFFHSNFLSELSMLLLITALLWFLITYLLSTDFGLAMRATGNSETMIRANGVDTDLMKIIGLGISNSLVALSGFLITQYQGFADINMGIGIVIVGLGSVAIGETLSGWLGLKQIQYRILGVITGTILFRLILAITLALGVNPNLLKLITAVFVLFVVALPNLRGFSSK